MNVPLAEHWQRFVRQEVQNGRFPSEAAVLEEALALLRTREHEEGHARAPNGVGTRWIGEIIDDLMSDVPEDVLARRPVKSGTPPLDHYRYGSP